MTKQLNNQPTNQHIITMLPSPIIRPCFHISPQSFPILSSIISVSEFLNLEIYKFADDSHLVSSLIFSVDKPVLPTLGGSPIVGGTELFIKYIRFYPLYIWRPVFYNHNLKEGHAVLTGRTLKSVRGQQF